MAYPNTAAAGGCRAVGTDDGFAVDTRPAGRRGPGLLRRQPHRRRARRRPHRENRSGPQWATLVAAPRRRRADGPAAGCDPGRRGHRAHPDRHHVGHTEPCRCPAPQGACVIARREERSGDRAAGRSPELTRWRSSSTATQAPPPGRRGGPCRRSNAVGPRARAHRCGLALEHVEEQPAELHLGARSRLARHRRPQRPVR